MTIAPSSVAALRRVDETCQSLLFGYSDVGINLSFVIERLILAITNGEEPCKMKAPCLAS